MCHKLNGEQPQMLPHARRMDLETSYQVRQVRTSLAVSFRSHTIFRRRNFSKTVSDVTRCTALPHGQTRALVGIR